MGGAVGLGQGCLFELFKGGNLYRLKVHSLQKYPRPFSEVICEGQQFCMRLTHGWPSLLPIFWISMAERFFSPIHVLILGRL